jgi:hypothetical protein
MSDPVAATNSAEIDYARIDGSSVGAVMIVISEGAASADTATEKKAATKTLTEGAAALDSLSSKIKSGFKTFTEAVGSLDTIPSKFKAATKTIYEGTRSHDQSYFYPFHALGKALSDHPLIHDSVGFFAAHIGKAKINAFYHRIKNLLDED